MEKKASKGAGFFHIDRRTWAVVCDLNDLNAAVAYLVIGNGTGEGNDISKWSAHSLEKWTGMRRPQGRAAIQKLIDACLLALGPEHTVAKPRYYLPAWGEIKTARSKKTKAFKTALMPNEDKAELIWLPNALVKGVSATEPSPVRAFRMADDLWSLRLFVDLYHAHHLASDAGVLRRHISQTYEPKQFGQQGNYVIWGFKSGDYTATWSGPLEAHRQRTSKNGESHPMWVSMKRLMTMGLVSYVPHLFTNANPEMEPTHSLGSSWNRAEPEEIAMQEAAVAAAQAMLQPGQVDQARADGFYLLLPVPKWLAAPQVVGVVRLRFRPQTSATGKWHENLVLLSPGWIERYRELEANGRKADFPVREWEAWGT